MVGQHRADAKPGGDAPNPLASPISIYITIEDPDAHHAAARAAGATVVRELEDMDYGSREYSVRDPEGNLWSFGTYDPYDYPEAVTRRTRALRYGASVAVALVGIACGAIIPGSAGGTAATVLVGIGLVGIVSLIFYEVGLTEDRERAAQTGKRERAERAGREARSRASPALRASGPPGGARAAPGSTRPLLGSTREVACGRWIGGGASAAGCADPGPPEAAPPG